MRERDRERDEVSIGWQDVITLCMSLGKASVSLSVCSLQLRLLIIALLTRHMAEREEEDAAIHDEPAPSHAPTSLLPVVVSGVGFFSDV